jgi:hypothetical protein
MTRILTRFEAELRAPFYLVVADYSDVMPSPVATACYGNGIWLDAEDAADALAEAIRENRDARVIRIDLEAGTAKDAGAEIHAIISRRMRERGIAAE